MNVKSTSIATLVLLVAGCAIQPPTTKEFKIESRSAAATTLTNPFCLHVKYNNNYYYFYSENYAEGWVTDGRCEGDGPRRSVESIGLDWRYSGEGLSGKQCSNTESCSFSERNYGIGKTIQCSGSSARDGNQSAHATTDQLGCP